MNEQKIKEKPLIELGKYKDVLIDLFMSDDDISELVMPKLDDDNFTYEQNWRGGKMISDKTGEFTVLNGHCLDVPYIHNVISDPYTFICMDTAISKISNNQIKKIELQINIISHKDAVRFDDETKRKYEDKGFSGNRLDMIVMAINYLLLDKSICEKFGIGDIQLITQQRYPIRSYVPNDNFYGKSMTYECSDFYITSNTKRKLGH